MFIHDTESDTVFFRGQNLLKSLKKLRRHITVESQEISSNSHEIYHTS
jgi:hypothetical protein